MSDFLPRHAMLAQYILLSCVRLFVRLYVRHNPVLYRNHWTNQAGMEASFYLSHTVLYGNLDISKNKGTWYFPVELCPKRWT